MADMNSNIMRSCRRNRIWGIIVPAFAVLLFFVVNLFYGSADIPANEVMNILIGNEPQKEVWQQIVLQSRLPQAVVALLCGMSLSVAGLMLQTFFNNPLAGPEVFGINSGAGLGVAVVMLLLQGTVAAGEMTFTGYFAVLSGAFVGAFATIAVILFFSAMLRGNLFLLIIGISLSYFASSLISLLNYFSTSEGVHSYLMWGMGNFGSVSLKQLPLFVLLSVLPISASFLMMKPLNALLLGNAYAENLGIKTKQIRGMILFLTGVLTAVVTAYCGPVSFIGLAVPHVARLLLKSNDHRLLLPSVLFIGGGVALFCNMACQLPGESGLIPLSAITPLLGTPVIVYVILKGHINR